jgi:hypothetical protein
MSGDLLNSSSPATHSVDSTSTPMLWSSSMRRLPIGSTSWA